MKPSQMMLVILATVLAAALGCSRGYLFEGIVVDGDGNPIGGATINLYPHDWKRQSFGRPDGTSEEDGTFKANWGSAVGIGFFQMVVEKEGFREQQQLVKADAKNLRILLERIETPADASDSIEPQIRREI